MSCRSREPSLQEMLSDPVIQAIMDADGVDRRQLEAIMTAIRQPSSAASWGRRGKNP